MSCKGVADLKETADDQKGNLNVAKFVELKERLDKAATSTSAGEN